MPEYVINLRLEDGELKAKVIADSDEIDELREKFQSGGIAVGRTINELKIKQKNLIDLFERTEIGSTEYHRLKQEIDKTNESLKSAEHLTQKLNSGSKSFSESFAQWSNIVTGFNQGLELAGKLYNVLSKPIDAAGQFEQLNTQFEVLLGSQEKAVKLVGDIQQLGANTPLELMDLQKNAKTLLSFGIAGEEVLDILRMLGDVSGGDAERLSQLALAFGKVTSQGKMTGEQLDSMVFAGFNPLRVISEQTGKSINTLRKEMSEGAITADMVTGAFTKATSQGGQFYQMMEKQSATYGGMVSNLEDSVTMILAGIGQEMLPFVKSLTGELTATIKLFTPVKTNVDKVNESAEQQRMAFERLVIQYEQFRAKSKLTNEESGKFNGIIDTLQSKYPELFKNLDLHKGKIEKIRDAFRQTRQAIEETIRAELKQAELKDLVTEQVPLEKERERVKNEKLNNEALLNRIKEGTLADTYKTVESKAFGSGPKSMKYSDLLKQDIQSNEKYLSGLDAQWNELEKKKNQIFSSGGKLPEGPNPTPTTPTADLTENKFLSARTKAMQQLRKEEEEQLARDAYTLYNFRELAEARIEKEQELADIVIKIRSAKSKEELEALEFDKDLAQSHIKIIDDQMKKEEDATDKIVEEGRKRVDAKVKAHVDEYNMIKESTEKYYDKVKFDDDDYVNYKAKKVNEELVQMRNAGLSELELSQYKIASMKELEEEFFDWKWKQYEKDHKLLTGSLDVMWRGYDTFFSSLTDTSITGKERMQQVWDTIKSSFVSMLAELAKQYLMNLIQRVVISETFQAAEIATAYATGAAIATAYAPAAALASIATMGAADIAGSAGLASTVALAYLLATPKLPGFAKGGIVVGEKGPEIIAPMQSYAEGQAQLVSEAVFAVERKLTSLNFEIANGKSGGSNTELLNGMNKLNSNIEKLFKIPPQITEDACGVIYETGRRLAGRKF